MRRKIFVFSVGAVAVAFAGLAVTVSAFGAQSEPAKIPVQTAAQHYVMRSENGKVTVFTENSEFPEIETEIETSRLREYDRQLLEKGIEVEGYESVVGLLEDFSN